MDGCGAADRVARGASRLNVVDSARNKVPASALVARNQSREFVMGRYLLLWLLGVPIPILLLIWAFGGLT
jgi:hypothetical protein